MPFSRYATGNIGNIKQLDVTVIFVSNILNTNKDNLRNIQYPMDFADKSAIDIENHVTSFW